MKYKILEKVSIGCIILAAIGVFAAIFYSSDESTKTTELLGQLTCVVSLVGMGITFALWDREDSETELYRENVTPAQTEVNQPKAEAEPVAVAVDEAQVENTQESSAEDEPKNSEDVQAEDKSDAE